MEKFVEGAPWSMAAFHEWRHFPTAIVKTLPPEVSTKPCCPAHAYCRSLYPNYGRMRQTSDRGQQLVCLGALALLLPQPTQAPGGGPQPVPAGSRLPPAPRHGRRVAAAIPL